MSARLTTSPARRTRYSSSAYSLAVRIISRPPAARGERQRPRRQTARQDRQPAAADQRAQPREQLAEIERLHEVVVGAAIETRDARLDRVPRRHHQDRDGAAALADRPADHE